MSRQITQPINQVRLTNVAVVRMNRNGKRFEIACYRNKVVNYRQGLETDLSEVLQTDRVFTNVSKGQFANRQELAKAFPDCPTQEDICQYILQKGELQVSDLERAQQLEQTAAQVATWIASNTCNPTNHHRPYTLPQIRHAMQQANFVVHPNRSLKRQYLDCVKLLKQVIPLERAKMELTLHYPTNQHDTVTAKLETWSVDNQTTKLVVGVVAGGNQQPPSSTATEQVVTFQADPSLYRELDDFAKEISGRLEILQQVVTPKGDVDLENDMERKKQQPSQQTSSTQAIVQSTDHTSLEQLASQLEQQVLLEEESADQVHEHQEEQPQTASSQRKLQKKQQKKSKKAKRREKEEAAERQARLEQEQARRQAATMAEQPAAVARNAQLQQENSDQTTSRTCNTCGGSFSTALQYRAHFKSDWHRYNQQLKLQGAPPVSEEEFTHDQEHLLLA